MARLRIATFNVEHLGHRGAVVPIEVRVRALAPMLEQLDADVLCLQEVDAQRTHRRGPREMRALDALLAPTRYRRFHRAFTPGESGGGADIHNLVVLSRYPIVAQRAIAHALVPPLRRTDGELVTWDRPLLHVEIDAGARRLHVIALHLRAPIASALPAQKLSANRWRTIAGWAQGMFLAELKRTGQALEARLLVEQLFDADGDDAWIAVAGDLNADLDETSVRTLLADPADTGNPALAPRALYATETSLPAVARFSVIHHGRRRLLDHILLSRDLARSHISTEIRNARLRDEWEAFMAREPIVTSFHAPVVSEVAL